MIDYRDTAMQIACVERTQTFDFKRTQRLELRIKNLCSNIIVYVFSLSALHTRQAINNIDQRDFDQAALNNWFIFDLQSWTAIPFKRKDTNLYIRDCNLRTREYTTRESISYFNVIAFYNNEKRGSTSLLVFA